jgi:hypothetical protein
MVPSGMHAQTVRTPPGRTLSSRKTWAEHRTSGRRRTTRRSLEVPRPGKRLVSHAISRPKSFGSHYHRRWMCEKSGIESFVFLSSDESCASSDSALIQYVMRGHREGKYVGCACIELVHARHSCFGFNQEGIAPASQTSFIFLD